MMENDYESINVQRLDDLDKAAREQVAAIECLAKKHGKQAISVLLMMCVVTLDAMRSNLEDKPTPDESLLLCGQVEGLLAKETKYVVAFLVLLSIGMFEQICTSDLAVSVDKLCSPQSKPEHDDWTETL